MSIPLTINGAVFNYPVNFDTNWGIDATGWAQAVTAGMLQKAGGSFPLTADVDFGDSFGLISQYFTSESVNPSTSGTLRLASADPGVGFRNNANSGNLLLTTDSSDNLVWAGNFLLQNTNSLKLQDSGNLHTISVHSPSVTTNYSLVLPPNTGSNGQFLQTDGTGVTSWVNAVGSGTVNSGTAGRLGVYGTTGTTIGDNYLQNGNHIFVQHAAQGSRFVDVTLTIPNVGDGNAGSSFIMADSNGGSTQTIFTPIQLSVGSNQLRLGNFNTIAINAVNPAANRIYTLPDAGASANFILSAGSPTFAAPVAMGANKITGLANGTAATDVAAFGQVQYGFQTAVQTTTTTTTVINSASYLATSITATITPTSSSSRIKIMAYIAGVDTITPNTVVTLFRNGSTDLGAATVGFFKSFDSTTVPVTITFIDSPSTTAATTYTVYAKNSSSSASINPAGSTCVMMLEELR